MILFKFRPTEGISHSSNHSCVF